MKNSHHRNKHQRKKSIKEAEKAGYTTDEQVGWNESDKSRHFVSDEKLKIYRGKVDPSKQHHKTSTKDTTWQTEPDNAHREGKRWISTIAKQAKNKASRLKSKIDKYYSRKKK